MHACDLQRQHQPLLLPPPLWPLLLLDQAI
jgi:hypothetical protein